MGGWRCRNQRDLEEEGDSRVEGWGRTRRRKHIQGVLGERRTGQAERTTQGDVGYQGEEPWGWGVPTRWTDAGSESSSWHLARLR